jgi:hypothetical protein
MLRRSQDHFQRQYRFRCKAIIARAPEVVTLLASHLAALFTVSTHANRPPDSVGTALAELKSVDWSSSNSRFR